MALRYLLLLSALLSAPCFASLSRARAFMGQLVEITKLSRDTSGKSDAGSDQRIKDLSAQIDFTALAKRSLGARWGKFPENERKEFLKTLQDLLEVVVFPNAKRVAASPADLRYVEQKGNRVKVIGKVEREKNGENITQSLEIVLIFDPKSDKIVDAVIEDEIFSENLKRQFTEALKKQSFATIIEKMKKRVNEARNPKASP